MMKKTTLLLMIVGLWMISCEKDSSKDSIDYNYSVDSKKNILELNDGDSILANQTYAFYADLGKKATLKVILTNLTEDADPNIPFPNWFYSNKVNWDVTKLANSIQTFTSIGEGAHNADFMAFPAPGKAKMDFYENSDNITKSVTFIWL